MEDRYTPILTEEERAARRAQRAAARQEKLRARRRKRLLTLVPVLALCLIAGILSAWPHSAAAPQLGTARPPATAPAAEGSPAPYSAQEPPATVALDASFSSPYAVLIDLEDGTILAEKEARTVIAPASMTKILTLLTAVEHLSDLDATFTITREITDYCYVNECSVVGLEVGETVTIRELLYGTILSSGADAALGLAYHISGSQEAFVALMNEKLEALGLSDTAHFTNCVGLYEEGHGCSVYDMAMILKAALDDPLCREILSAHTYETAPTPQHPDGQVLSNWFLRKIEDHVPEDFQVIAAKTGFVDQSGNCAASYGEDASGQGYLCVTAGASGSWPCIYDHLALYETYCL